jgi:MoaA/NifB/PqqE/SkfB family radical SAM enzyme
MQLPMQTLLYLAKKPKQFLSLETIKQIVNSHAVSRNTVIGLEGGEFILHPEYREILEYFRRFHPNFDLLSNCMNPDKLIEAVRCYPPKRLFISLDGMSEIHNVMRGVNGLYPKVLKVIDELKDVVPVSVMFTLTPFNSMDDMRHVADICRKANIDLRAGIYNNMEYFETKESASSSSMNYEISDIPQEIKMFSENYDFLALYCNYRKQGLRLTCNSIRDSLVIYPNGDVPLCQNKQIVLGNLLEESLDQIINKKTSRDCIRAHKNCNGCWINFHRKYDIVLYRSLERILPKKAVEWFMGKYFWESTGNQTYKSIFANCKKSETN